MKRFALWLVAPAVLAGLTLTAVGCEQPAAAKTTAPRAQPGPLGYTKVLEGVTDIEAAEAKVRAALKAQGFGIITRIDVQAVMKKKLQKDVRPYRILGACNPGYAHQAIEVDPQMGLLLPCKAIVYQRADGKIVIKGKHLLSRAKGTQRIKGGSVEIN